MERKPEKLVGGSDGDGDLRKYWNVSLEVRIMEVTDSENYLWKRHLL